MELKSCPGVDFVVRALDADRPFGAARRYPRTATVYCGGGMGVPDTSTTVMSPNPVNWSFTLV